MTDRAGPAEGRALLRLQGIALQFGGVKALQGVSFEVASVSICGLIGPKGAGMTSLCNCLSRLYDCQAGEIEFAGAPITRLPPHRIAPLGIGRTFQNLAMFRTLSVADNVRVGRHGRTSAGFFANALRLPVVGRERRETERRLAQVLDFLDLGRDAQTRVSELPFGTQKRVELARALVGEPRLLLLDEPACGLNHEEVGRLGALIRRIRDELRTTVLLVEHHMGLVMSVSDHVVALNFGKVLAAGTPQAVANHPEVVAAYLGRAR